MNKTEDYSEILKEIEEKYSGVMVVLEGGTRIPLFEFSAFEKDLIKALKTIEERAREEIKKQLELTLLMHEKEENESPTVEPLESKIRAFIRHFLDTLNTKK